MSVVRQSAPLVRFGINEVDVKTEDSVAVHVIRPLAGFGLSWYKLAPAGTWSRQVLSSSHPSHPIRVRALGELPAGDRDDARETDEAEVT